MKKVERGGQVRIRWKDQWHRAVVIAVYPGGLAKVRTEKPKEEISCSISQLEPI